MPNAYGHEIWWENREVHMLPPTIDGASVNLPANTIYIRPSDGRIFRTV